ncbi:unnamed protein product [Rhizophagus irregularis]|uniref:chitin deacetylase n=1 Tax=Rhizophagus irregularis TaxID=588596 RepID=A0A2N1MQG1_9GLOM|nr:glycoside hydrolase/deacetylase [Rhizophagus irregularis]CAB4375904.1 unnamed protein product [Rhizophagus irregularis]CAB5388049.1 unnamed protein product [Rhizophagus irregularis]
MLSLLYIFALVLSFLAFVNAQLPGNWPPVDKPPPVNDEWTKLVDMSQVPKAPISKVAGDCGATDNFCNWSCTTCVRTNTTDIIQCPGKTDWGLSFDDGPTEFTPPLLDYLNSQNVKLTFFVIGSRVIENPDTLKNEFAAGHQIGVHTWSHTALTTQSNEEIIAEIKWTELAIKTAIGVTPKYMRPPYGDVDDRVRSILSQLGYKIVIWDKDTNDWMSGEDKNFQVSWVEGNFTEWVKEDDPTGHISLEHDLYKPSAEQGPLVVPIVQGAGFTIKPVAQCVGDTQPYLESTNTGTTDTTTGSTTNTTTGSTTDTTTGSTTDTTAGSTTDTNSVVADGTQNLEPSSVVATSPTATTTSSAISHINNNNYLLSFVLFILGYFMVI